MQNTLGGGNNANEPDGDGTTTPSSHKKRTVVPQISLFSASPPEQNILDSFTLQDVDRELRHEHTAKRRSTLVRRIFPSTPPSIPLSRSPSLSQAEKRRIVVGRQARNARKKRGRDDAVVDVESSSDGDSNSSSDSDSDEESAAARFDRIIAKSAGRHIRDVKHKSVRGEELTMERARKRARQELEAEGQLRQFGRHWNQLSRGALQSAYAKQIESAREELRIAQSRPPTSHPLPPPPSPSGIGSLGGKSAYSEEADL